MEGVPAENKVKIQKVSWFQRIPRKVWVVLGATIILAVATPVGLKVYNENFFPVSSKTIVSGEKEVGEQQLRKLADAPLAANATPEAKADYYRKLAIAKADTKDFVGAAQAYEERAKTAPASMLYTDYYTLAVYHNESGNKAAALAALNKSELALPATDNSETGYYREIALERINALRKEINK